MTDASLLSATSEIYPLIKTGGLADVTGALPAALAAEGVAVRTLVPGYPSVVAKLSTRGAGGNFSRPIRRQRATHCRHGGRSRTVRARCSASL